MASLPIPTREVPLELKCSICWEISIDPVIPAKTLTDEKIEEVCKHFLCKTCEHINKEIDLENRSEINCPQCMQKYSQVLPDEDTAKKVKDFVDKNPLSFDRKSYDELVEIRKASIPIAFQILNAIKNNKFDEIEKITALIENPKEKSKILFEIAKKQTVHNSEAAKTIINLISNKIHKKLVLPSIILTSMFLGTNVQLSDKIEEIEKFIESISDKSLISPAFFCLSNFLQALLTSENVTLDKEAEEYLSIKAVEYSEKSTYLL